MSLIMADKITSSQFRLIYQELTGDKSVTDNKNCKEADERMQLILKTADEVIIRDLRMKNGGHMKQFDAFWNVTEKKLNEFQATAVNDRCHTLSTEENENVVTNMAIAISAKDLYEHALPKLKHKKYNKSKHRLYRGSDLNSGPKILITIRQ